MRIYGFRALIYGLLLCIWPLFTETVFARVQVEVFKAGAASVSAEKNVIFKSKKYIYSRKYLSNAINKFKLNITNIAEEDERVIIEGKKADKEKWVYILDKKLGIETLKIDKKDDTGNTDREILNDRQLIVKAEKFIQKYGLAKKEDLHLFRINELWRIDYVSTKANEPQEEKVECKQFEFRRKKNGSLILGPGSLITINITPQGDIENVFIDWPDFKSKAMPIRKREKIHISNANIEDAVGRFMDKLNASAEGANNPIVDAEVKDVIFVYNAKKIENDQLDNNAEIDREISPAYVIRCKLKTMYDAKEIKKDLFLTLDGEQI